MQVSEAHCQCGWVGHPRQLDAHIRLDHRVGEPPRSAPASAPPSTTTSGAPGTG
jgi:hypothetical protein